MRRISLFALAVLLVGLALPARTASAVGSANRQLNAVLPELRFDGVSLADAVDFLRDVSGANISVNWKVLEGSGISRDMQITVRLRSVTLRKGLDIILSELAGSGKVGWTIDQNVIEITSQEAIDAQMYTRVYPVLDLITDIPDFTDAPDFSLTSTSNNSAQNGSGGAGGVSAGGGGSGGLFGNSSTGSGSGSKEKEGKTRTERADELMDLIRNIVQPDIWIENGGKAALRYWNGNLVITAPRSALEAIGGPFD